VRFTRDVNFETRTMETEVDVENKDLSISPGMYANTLLQLAHVTTCHDSGRGAGAEGHQETVYVARRGNRIHIRNVEVGCRDRSSPRSRAAFNPGDRVVLGGQEKYPKAKR
jgi:hypothetical protein